MADIHARDENPTATFKPKDFTLDVREKVRMLGKAIPILDSKMICLKHKREIPVSNEQWMRSFPDIPTALRQLREEQQLTMLEVAELAGVSKAYIARLEYGERMPERDTLIALLLASYSLPVSQANRILLLAGFAPLHHRMLAKSA